MKLTEKQIEDVFSEYYEALIEPGLVFLKRQHIFENRLRADLLFKDCRGKTVILELKKDAVTREDIGQIFEYAGMINQARVILAAPLIPDYVKRAFEHYGIQYLEFSITKISSLYEAMNKVIGGDKKLKNGFIMEERADGNLIQKKIVDGNIAFKVTFCDSNWNGVCSEKLYQYNSAHRLWCRSQGNSGVDCRSKDFKNYNNLTRDCYPCYEAIALKELMFSPGIYDGPQKAGVIPCLHSKVGKIAIFSSRRPGEDENQRFIFALGKIARINRKCSPVADAHSEIFFCDKDSAVILNENQYLQFWNYYRNPNAPQKIAWGTGLFRYVDDQTVRKILEDLSRKEGILAVQRIKAKKLLEIF
ncbi:MAG TPA: hypothetical protein PLM07_18790 [Candidatus Rifleibacterium sp.]|nr:hypothetical protein [Candidatus Rifleibacterium sp.]HPT47932.1 hypothetical protein [Candidatus Rifleibacterium sp.]